MGGLRKALALARDTRGIAAMEAVIVAPVLMLLTFGAADGAWYFIQTHKMETGLSAGGSYLAQTAGTTADEARARRLAVTGSLGSTGKPRIAGWSSADVTITYPSRTTSVALRDGANTRVARLSTSVPYKGLGVISGVRGRQPLSLSATFETRIAG